MSLKAQIEAIIYAADEPVTLDQLVILLKNDIIAIEQQGSVPPEPEVAANEPAALNPAPDAEAPKESETAEAEPSASDESDGSDKATDTADAETLESTESPEGEVLNPKRAQREETRRHKQLVREMVEELINEYASAERAMEIRELAGGYRMSTKPEHHDLVRSFAKGTKPPIKLSLPALETLAVIAYKQPITAPEISEVRGVDSSGVLSSLISRKLITTAGRKQVVGRPILYKTTKEFLLRFGLKDVNELPSMEEFEKISSQTDFFEPEAEQPQAETEAEPKTEAADDDSQPANTTEGAIAEDFAEAASEVGSSEGEDEQKITNAD
jgi:segregation and condensation protein B